MTIVVRYGEKKSSLAEIEKVIEKDEKKVTNFFGRQSTINFLIIFVFAVLLAGVLYLSTEENQVYIENSLVDAPVISLSSETPGVLDYIFVKEGDHVTAGMTVAEVNGTPIKAQIDGLVTSVFNTPGQIVNSETPIVNMIDPQQLRIVGALEEDKGLKDIKVGQKAVFTLDAFGSEKFDGVVDSIGQTSAAQDIVFSISSTRQEKNFDVYVKFDANQYPQIKSGMSAKIWVYK